jgi:CHRD domain-containing protein
VKKLITLLGAGVLCTLALAAFSSAAPQKVVWTAALSSGQEIPKQVVKQPAAHGLFKGTLSGTTLKWKLTFARLTGPAMQAHIHIGAKGRSGNVAVALCAPCQSGMTGTSTISSTLLKDFQKHMLYVNVHTAKNPAGEIRGQLARG